MTAKFLTTLLLTAMTLPSMSAAEYDWAGRQTEYYTMVTKSVVKRHCRGEGNQITGGELIGYKCKPVQKYCRWGVGSRDNCLIPCVDGAGAAKDYGKTKKLQTPVVCKYGPFKGKTIRYVRIGDVGEAVQGAHVDVFQGLCLREKVNRRGVPLGVCDEFGEEKNYAEYRGTDRYDDTQKTVVALLQAMGMPTQLAGVQPANSSSRQQYAELQTGVTAR